MTPHGPGTVFAHGVETRERTGLVGDGICVVLLALGDVLAAFVVRGPFFELLSQSVGSRVYNGKQQCMYI